MNAREAESYLRGLPRFADAPGKAYRPGLERIRVLLEGMGHPQDAYETVLVAGTNGKGSTASMLAAIGTAAGLRVGLHTSPHLTHVAERMRIDGIAAPAGYLWEAIARHHALSERVGPSYFELTVAISLLYFAQENVDLAVIEVGMGGRLDATNILQPALCVITDVGLDHTEYLGSSIGSIAVEKAGIIKPGIPVVTSAEGDARAAIERISEERESEFYHAGEEIRCTDAEFELQGTRADVRSPLKVYDRLYVGLPGEHQLRNGGLALRAAELVYDDIQNRAEAVFDGMRNVRMLSGLRGRLDVHHENPLIIADVAHNADGLAAAIRHLRNVNAVRGRLHVLFGLMRDKDVDAMMNMLASARAVVHPVPLASDRALSPEELDDRLRVGSVESVPFASVEEGVQSFLRTADSTDTLLVTGSHLVVAALYGS